MRNVHICRIVTMSHSNSHDKKAAGTVRLRALSAQAQAALLEAPPDHDNGEWRHRDTAETEIQGYLFLFTTLEVDRIGD